MASRLLEEVPKHSSGDSNAGIMLIQGDNLDALKALLPVYAGRIKCIYIDPPYNTRSAFEQYDDNLLHSSWLAMMWPWLELLRELLAEDGSIWVSIDDNEAHCLRQQHQWTPPSGISTIGVQDQSTTALLRRPEEEPRDTVGDPCTGRVSHVHAATSQPFNSITQQ